ncbi:MAG: methionine--tRNA ligase [Treponema sp.]|nr:methionine--tRNA ligase [Treponema sp.]MCL2251563.1 methionine--tRNA ligase [Treponema sp.]
MKRRLITSALPYVNNVPHLGNLIQVLSADAFARFCRLNGIETLYVCGTDEYGTATENKAAEEGVSPKELCDRYHAIHAEIYSWFNIAFDKFGRTSTKIQTEVVQDIFLKLDKEGLICEKTNEQFFCEKCERFLADRYIRGVCPVCGSADARGDQCEACGKLLDPTDLKEPQCSACTSKPSLKKTDHLYIDLPKISGKLENWMKKASVEGFWAHNAIQMTQAMIRDGLKERAITRDLKWGIPVPKQGYEKKVFYVWFDAPIGYISITGLLGEEKGDWRKFVDYWWKNPEEVDLFQFIGKDNVTFHTVIFPSSLLGSADKWTMLHHMSSSEYLNYENSKFSKSKGIGVFGTDAMETGIPSDVWRFYIYYNRPEKSDVMFTWDDFKEKVNGELIGNFGNLVNRTLSFVTRYYDGKIPYADSDSNFWEEVTKYEKSITEKLDKAYLRDAFREIFELSSFANKYFQDNEPWRLRNENPNKACSVIRDLAYIVRDLSVLIEPFLPQSAAKIASFFKLKHSENLSWKDIGKAQGIGDVQITSEVLFSKLEDDKIKELRERFSGTQKERNEAGESSLQNKKSFSSVIDLRVAKIEKIERHPKADKLYIINLEAGEGVTGVRDERQIVSGLVPFYKEEELLGKQIIVAYNLKTAKLRGIESKGMLLAAGDNNGTDSEGKPSERVEVLDSNSFPTGTRFLPEGEEILSDLPEIDIDTFFSYSITVKDYIVQCEGKKLCLNGKEVRTKIIKDGEVG